MSRVCVAGKTAAFLLPVLERLLYKPKQAPVTRVLVLTPTRELAVQIHTVARQLTLFTKIEVSLSAGKEAHPRVIYNASKVCHAIRKLRSGPNS